MSKYDVETLIERDAQGRVVRARAKWGETRPATEQLLAFLFGASVLASAAGLLWAMAAKSLNPLVVGGALGVSAWLWMLFRVGGRPRGVVFHADGRMETPHGIYHHPHVAAIGGHSDDLVSIEARPQHEQVNMQGGSWIRLFEVVMLFNSGTLITVSKNLPEHVALRAAAQLTRGLNALRKDRDDGHMNGVEPWAEMN